MVRGQTVKKNVVGLENKLEMAACPVPTTTEQKLYSFNNMEAFPSSREQPLNRMGVEQPRMMRSCNPNGSTRQICQANSEQQGHVLALSSTFTRQRPRCNAPAAPAARAAPAAPAAAAAAGKAVVKKTKK